MTLVGIAITNLDDDSAMQLALPFDGRPPLALDAALDEVRTATAPTRSHVRVLLGRDPGISVPLLPD